MYGALSVLGVGENELHEVVQSSGKNTSCKWPFEDIMFVPVYFRTFVKFFLFFWLGGVGADMQYYQSYFCLSYNLVCFLLFFLFHFCKRNTLVSFRYIYNSILSFASWSYNLTFRSLNAFFCFSQIVIQESLVSMVLITS